MDQPAGPRTIGEAPIRAPLLTPPERQRMMRTVLEASDLALIGRLADGLRLLAGSAEVAADAFGSTRMGALLFQAGDVEGALRAFDAAIALDPEYGDAHCNRGVALQRMKRLAEALAAYEAAIRHEPGNVTAHFNRGNVLAMLDQLDEAAKSLSLALVLDPGLADAEANLGFVALARRDVTGALDAFNKALAIDPGHEAAARARADVLRQLGRAGPTARPVGPPRGDTRAEAALSRARVLVELGRYHEVLKIVGVPNAFGPVGARLTAARAAALWRMGRHADALEAGRKATRLAPDDPEMHEELAYLYLKMGDFARGWEEYEHRLAKPFVRRRSAAQAAPLWQGEDLRGRRIRVLSEQGNGDTLQFVRYLPLLIERGATVTAVVQASVREVLRSMPAPVDWTDALASPSDDFHVHLLSLPHRFATRLDTIPASTPYLFAEPARVERWRERIGSAGYRIGVAWQGNPNQGTDHLRSIALAEFAPLAAVAGVRLVSLQALRGIEQMNALPAGMAVEDLGPEIRNNPDGMREIAAAMACLDLVVTSDTAIAHLAGALARPTWVGLHHDPDWRWLRDRPDSPWYPTMRLFRQKRAGDWAGVFDGMAAALRQAVSGSLLA